MTIPVYRHNLDHDDWEVASVYDSDDCGSLGGSAYDESLHSSGALDNPALRLESYPCDDTRLRFANGYPLPQQQHQNYPPAVPAPARARWDTHYVPGKQSSFVVPPPGVIFPPKDWVLPPQDMYWPCTTSQMASSPDMPIDVGLIGSPPPAPLLLSPPSPPRAPSPLIKRPSPTTPIAHGQPLHPASVAVPGAGTGTNVNGRASPIMPPPPRYHEVAPIISPRLADAGRQAHSSMAMSPPRRSGHDGLSSYTHSLGHASMQGLRSSEEFGAAEGRYGGGHSGHPNYGPADRPDIRPPLVPTKYEHEHELEREREREQDGGRTRAVRPLLRERRPSMWQRFVRRFSSSHGSVGQT